jgi:hypothetical protein
MFEGFITGAFAFLVHVTDTVEGALSVSCLERYCAGDGAQTHCAFEFRA